MGTHGKKNAHELSVSKDMIKKVTLEYVVNNLEGNIPDKEVRDMVKLRRDIQLENMKDTSGESFEIDEDDFNNVLAKFKSKTTKTYDFLLKAGTKYQSALFELCKMMIQKEEFPKSFKQTVLYMIWKRKGAMDVLKNNRYLHMK